MFKITFDKPAFERAIVNKIRLTKKAESEVVNRALRDVAFRAASFTPKSSAANINAIDTVVLAKIASRSLKKKKGKFARRELKQEMKRIVRRRKAGIGALRAGWIPAIEALGGTYRGAKKKVGSSAAAGTAIKAIPARLNGLISNTIQTQSADGKHSAPDIAVSVAGLERAIEYVTADLQNYARKKIEKALQEASDK